MTDGPPWTVQSEQRLPNGRVELVVRERGGRLVRLRMTALAVAEGNRDANIAALLDRLRPVPGYYAN